MRKIEVLQRLENAQGRDPARWGWRRVKIVAAIADAQRLGLLNVIAREVFLSEQPAVALNLFGNALGGFAGVEGARIVGQSADQLPQIRLPPDLPDSGKLAIREDRVERGLVSGRRPRFDRARQRRGDRETLLGQFRRAPRDSAPVER